MGLLPESLLLEKLGQKRGKPCLGVRLKQFHGCDSVQAIKRAA